VSGAAAAVDPAARSAAVLSDAPLLPVVAVLAAPLAPASGLPRGGCFSAPDGFEFLSADDGVATLEGAALSSASSITNAASKTAGSGFAATSPFASLDVTSPLAFFVGLGRRAGDWPPRLLEDRDRRGPAFPGACDACCESRLVLCLACSSAMVRSIAPLSLCDGHCQFAPAGLGSQTGLNEPAT